MNNKRRKQIGLAIGKIEEASNILQEVLDEEEEAFDNMPENLQGSIRGEESQEAIDLLGSSIDSMEELINELETI